MTNLKDKSFLVLGLGLSGVAAAERLLALGAKVTVTDLADTANVLARAKKLKLRGAKTIPWTQPLAMVQGQETVVVSPGVRVDSPVIKAARRLGLTVMSELELAYRLTDAPVIAVTGTNGKSTVVTLLGEIFDTANLPNIVAGNIGRPLVDAVATATHDTTLIVEVSSFQLEGVIDFKPKIGVVLNITEDHLDRHDSMRSYGKLKGRLFANQDHQDYAVVNLDDDEVGKILGDIPSVVVPFSLNRTAPQGVFVDHDRIWAALPPEFLPAPVGRVTDIKLKGKHNLENALAAVATSLLSGISPETIMKSLAGFKGLRHRIELVDVVDGVSFYDDSKATNPDAAKRALESFDEPVIIIAGGRNKGMDFHSMVRAMKERGKTAVLFGESAEELATMIAETGGDTALPFAVARSIDEAVIIAKASAAAGDVVLLSPGCASFDMFKSYEERGRAYQDAVKRLDEDRDLKGHKIKR